MYFQSFLKLFLTLLAIALIAFFIIPEADFMLLVKLIALSLGISILIALFYPRVRGIKKGDKVLVSNNNLPSFLGAGRVAIASVNGKVNSEIKLKFSNGREGVGIVEDLGGTFNIPKVRLLYEESIKE